VNAVQDLRGKAETLARLLLTVGSIEDVGLFGSVAREEPKPSDIDIAVFVEGSLPQDILDGDGEGEDEECWWLGEEHLYALSVKELLEALDATGLQDQVKALLGPTWAEAIVLPVEADRGFYRQFAWLQPDRLFLHKVAPDFQLFSVAAGKFVRAQAPWEPFLTKLYGVDASGRPHWGPCQVRTFRGVSRGLIVSEVSGVVSGGVSTRLVILGGPYCRREATDGSPWASAAYLAYPYLTGECREVSLADRSVVPYVGPNSWNQTGRLLRTGRRRMTEEEIQIFLAAHPQPTCALSA